MFADGQLLRLTGGTTTLDFWRIEYWSGSMMQPPEPTGSCGAAE
jgi:hypothetical protein